MKLLTFFICLCTVFFCKTHPIITTNDALKCVGCDLIDEVQKFRQKRNEFTHYEKTQKMETKVSFTQYSGDEVPKFIFNIGPGHDNVNNVNFNFGTDFNFGDEDDD